MTVATKNNSPSGNYTVTLNGNASGQPQQSTTVALNLNATGKNFTITGPSFSSVAPGVTVRLDLSLTNPNNQSLSVTNLTVTVQSVTKAAGIAPGLTCTPSDYVVTQFAGSYPLTIPSGPAVKLSDLGVAVGLRPSIGMPNSNSANQDGCVGATITLGFTGAGQG
jgi:hypothetical protein